MPSQIKNTEIMRTIVKAFLIVLLAILTPNDPLMAQKGHRHGGNKKVIVKNKSYHNNSKVVVVNKQGYYHGHRHRHYRHHPHFYGKVYHPYWGPPVGYYRRWVFFPRYNFYWDNYNSTYVYWGNGVWVRTASPPPAIININISNEKKYELNETDDTIDDIYDSNDTHKKSYPES
ncbi:MAG: hypothetical protein K0S33_2030 [Bacteroidetes bacterium]|jgi:hypothetical protein|nr:hypothetical protein [Bacteroidota bacterium]